MDENSPANRSTRRGLRTAHELVLAGLLLVAMRSSAAPITLLWDPSPDARVASYVVHYGTASGRYTSSVDAGNATTYTFTNLPVGFTYFLAVTAHDATGAGSAYSEEVTTSPPISPAPPIAAFEAYPTSGAAPLTVTFNSTSTGAISAYLWDFGDGNANAFSAGIPETSTTHTYTVPGTYTVRLSATGPGGNETVVKANLIVVAASSPGLRMRARAACGAAPTCRAIRVLRARLQSTSASDSRPSWMAM